MTLTPTRPATGPPELGGDGLALLSQALLALRSTSDLGTACAIAGACVVSALEAAEYRLLRIDSRSGAVRLLEESGVETPYLPEPGGPVEWVVRHEVPSYDEGGPTHAETRETLLWLSSPRALATVPLTAGNTLYGLLLVAFPESRVFPADQLLFVQTLGDALALALERAELIRLLDDERHRRSDIERRVLADEEASASLMSVVAHEIRTPLTAIKAYTETLLETLENPHTPRERFLGIINDECDRLTRLVTDILDLSRLEAGQRPLRLSRLEPRVIVDDVLAGLAPLARPRQVAFGISIESDLAVDADADLLKRLLINLLANAIKYSPVGAEVRLDASARGEEWCVTIADEGPGIPPEDLPRVFERFFRSRQPGDQHIEGSGLGLAIARGIVELHGGRIWVEAASPCGSRFSFTMPIRQMASSHARRIARQIVGRAEVRELFEATVEMVAAAMDAEIVSLMMVDPDAGDLFIAASCGLENQNLSVRRTTVRSGVAGSVAAWGRPVLVDNIETDRRFRRLNHPQYSTKSLLCVPLRVESEVLGVINVNNKASREAFDEHDLSLLVALVERIGSAVERAYAYPDSNRAIAEALEAVRSITRLRREWLLGSHSQVRRARATARELELSAADVDVIGYVAAIHDLGMTRLQRELFEKRGQLEQDQRDALVQHPEVSVEIIRPLEFLGSVRDLILSHHERWDGTGYPRGLIGEEIPLGGRILAVVDAYESMTRERPYRGARPGAEALAELRHEAGTQFDPRVVEALARVLDRESNGS
ncbi:MAG TPA: HD domain-containing phosphohydrolase [Candidatus Limnocylindria bacterium]|nr:HD domain-containing phosphohydrolase [Candidatus Limnocylindria bacterium]